MEIFPQEIQVTALRCCVGILAMVEVVRRRAIWLDFRVRDCQREEMAPPVRKEKGSAMQFLVLVTVRYPAPVREEW